MNFAAQVGKNAYNYKQIPPFLIALDSLWDGYQYWLGRRQWH